MRRRFLVNPAAGRGLNDLDLGSMRDFFSARDGHFDVEFCTSREHLSESATTAVRDGVDQIVAVGGDGTMNAVARGFFDDDLRPIPGKSALAIAPLGSGSDYFRSISGGRDWKELILDPKLLKVDTGRISFHTAEEYHFLNMAGVGISAKIVARKEKLSRVIPKLFPKKLSYMVPTLLELPGLKPFFAKVAFDTSDTSETIEGDFLSIFIGKGVFAGGGMRFGGDILLSDGKFEITLIESRPAYDVLRHLPRLFSNGISGLEGVTRRRATALTIETKNPVGIEADGECAGEAPVELSVIPSSIAVCSGL